MATPDEHPPHDDTPGDDTPHDDTPGDDTPGDDTPGDDTPGDDTPGDDAVQFAHRMFDLARAGDGSLVAYLDAGVPVDLTDASGNTLVMLAAYHGHPGLVGDLADRGADVDRANDRGQTPLAGAVFKRETDVIDALVAAGADPGLGTPSATETARFFGNDDLLARFER